jgi:hypothetical protein
MAKTGKSGELMELESIKRLLVCQLLNDKVPAKALAFLLKMDPADFSREFPARKIVK